jgi:hypothetical protein
MRCKWRRISERKLLATEPDVCIISQVECLACVAATLCDDEGEVWEVKVIPLGARLCED